MSAHEKPLRPSSLVAREVLELYSRSLAEVRERLDESMFGRAVDLLYDCKGMVVVTGMGKAGIIAQKISATLASTGTRAFCRHPAEAVQGDLGRVQHGDVVLVLSNSGTSAEMVRLLDPLKRLGAPLIAITGNLDSPLAQHADVVLNFGRADE